MATLAETPTRSTNLEAARDDFYDRLTPESLAPLWKVLAALVTPTPRTPAIPAAWSFDRVQPLLMEAGDLITAVEAERRVLILENPALPGQSRITNTLYAGLQLIMPGEVAPAHRHAQNALRFIMQGEGAFTALDGERAYMHKYDLILTPAWLWHDHGNETDQPMIWLDGLDIPLVSMLDASFAEHREDRGAVPTSRPAGDAAMRWGRNMRPVHAERVAGQGNPLFIYPFAEWRETLEVLRRSEKPHAHDAYLMEFTNPVDGGSVMATMSAFARLVPAGFETRAARSSDGMINVVVEGTGTLLIDGKAFPLTPGEIVVVPAWAKRRIAADSDLVLFSYSDRATQQKLSLWREQLGVSLSGKAAIVTGGASGIGLEIARDLASHGARVAICDIAGTEAAAKTIDGAIGVHADVSDETSVQQAVDATVAAFGAVDILVNNAGLFTTITRAPFDALPIEEWRRVLDVNVTGTYLFSRAVWTQMRRAGGGRIVNITSGSIWSAPAMMLHYVASKGALTAMTRSMAREMGADNITVNAVAPGFTLSSGVLENRQDMLDTARNRARNARALQRDQQPEDIVGAVTFLCGEGSRFITGQTLVVDGGAVMR